MRSTVTQILAPSLRQSLTTLPGASFRSLVMQARPAVMAAAVLGLALTLAPVATARDLYMISVGITNAKGQPHLAATAKDARDMSAWGREQKGKLAENVVTITILDSNATKAHVLATIKSLRARAKPADIVIFYESSHGSLTKSGDFQMIAYDRGITFREICEAFKGVAGTKVAIFDACHSGAAATSGDGADLVVFSSSQAKELSYDGDRNGNSEFTKHFLAGIRGKADYNKDHAITFQEAAKYAHNRLNEFNKGRATKDQQHLVWSLPQGTRSTLFISKMR